MASAPEIGLFQEGLPRTMRFCGICRRETSHVIRSGEGIVAMVCVPCLYRALDYELDRD